MLTPKSCDDSPSPDLAPASPQVLGLAAGELTTLGLSGPLFFHHRSRHMFPTASCRPPDDVLRPVVFFLAVKPGKPVDLRLRRNPRLGLVRSVTLPAGPSDWARPGNSPAVADVRLLGNRSEVASLGPPGRVTDRRRLSIGEGESGVSRSSSSSHISARSVQRERFDRIKGAVGLFRGSGGRREDSRGAVSARTGRKV